MKKQTIIILLFITIFLCINIYAQIKDVKKDTENKKNSKSTVDYKLTASTNTYLEIEYTPDYPDNTNYNFALSVGKNKPGEPDLGTRVFPVFFPSQLNNKAEILDLKYTDVQNIDIKPVPRLKRADNIYENLYDYIKNEKLYNTNAFFPGSFAAVSQDGVIRNKYFGYLNISPLLYNPVTKVLRKLSYIKVRVYFGSAPLYSPRTNTSFKGKNNYHSNNQKGNKRNCGSK